MNEINSSINRNSPDPFFLDWGLIDYQEALDKQLQLVDEVIAQENHTGYIVFCTHPSVVTIGRQTQPEDIFAWKGPIIEITRGGRATYHGPSQLVVYPILNLKKPRKNRGPQEIRGFLRDFEKAIVDTIGEYGVTAVGRTDLRLNSSTDGRDETGVWVRNQKIASLGIAVKRWVSYHGASINLDSDSEAFQGINPCGFSSSTMISLEKILNKPVDRSAFIEKLKKNLEII
jgi:lipoyl(octanoyl) transferase